MSELQDTMLTVMLAETVIAIYPHADCPGSLYFETRYADGACVPACGNTDEASVQHAHELGYAGDTVRMSLEHEILHTWLAVKQGRAYSPTLWHVAHDLKPERGLIRDEEAVVLAFQRYLRAGVWTDPLYILEDAVRERGHTVEGMARDAGVFLGSLSLVIRTLQHGAGVRG